MMVLSRMEELVKKAREGSPPRKFKQSLELIVKLKELGLKRQDFSLSENVGLPHPFPRLQKVCVIASRDMALTAGREGADRVMEPAEIDRLATAKREARKLSKAYDFFLAETSLMPRIGKTLGPFLGPKGKMPVPVPPNAPMKTMIQNLKSSIRVRTRASLAISCKVGEEGMSDKDLAENAMAVLAAVGKKLPKAEANIGKVILKLSMGKPAKQRYAGE